MSKHKSEAQQDIPNSLPCFADDESWWTEDVINMMPWTENENVVGDEEPSPFCSHPPVDIPLRVNQLHREDCGQMINSLAFDDLDLSLFDEAQLSLYINNDLLSELPLSEIAEPNSTHEDGSPHSWASYTAWMSGLNTMPTFSYIANLSKPDLLNDSKKRKRTNFDELQTQTLQNWLSVHTEYPYPTEDELLTLCESTGLELKQVRNWFARTRQRKLVRRNSRDYHVPWALSQCGKFSTTDHGTSSIGNNDNSQSSVTALLSVDVRAGSSIQTDSDSETSELDESETVAMLPTVRDTSTVKMQFYDSKVEWWLESVKTDVPSQLKCIPENLNFPFDTIFGDSEGQCSDLPFYLEDPENTILAPGHSDVFTTDSVCEDDVYTQQKLRTHILYLLRRGKDSWNFTTPGSSNSSLNSLLRHGRRRPTTFWSAGVSPSPSMEELSDNGRSLFSHQSFGSRLSLQSAATSFSFGSRQGRKPQYRLSSADLHDEVGYQSNLSPVASSQEVNKNQCRFCGKTFSRPSSVTRHEKAVHVPECWWICGLDAQKDSQSCPACTVPGIVKSNECHHDFWKCSAKSMNDRVFLRRDNFQDHLRRVHHLTRLECTNLNLSRWKHDQGDVASVLDAQKKSTDFQNGLKNLDKMPSIPIHWGVVLRETLEEEIYDAEDIAMELGYEHIVRTTSTQELRKSSRVHQALMQVNANHGR